jgi:FkbM family methyltransferase
MNYGRGTLIETSGERWVLQYLAEHLRHNDKIIAFDVGANVGQYTAEFIGLADKDKVIAYCFEPNRADYEQLVKNHSENPTVHCINLGMSDKEEKAILYDNGSVYDLTPPYGKDQASPCHEISLTTIDAFCASEGIARIDFLKIDIEGHEFHALMGGRKMLESGGIRFIQWEFSPCNIDSRTYFRDFFNLLNPSHDIYRVLQHGLDPIKRYDGRLEVFRVTNYLAVFRDSV